MVGKKKKNLEPTVLNLASQEVKSYRGYVDVSFTQKRLYDDSTGLLLKPPSPTRNEGYVSPRTAYSDAH